MPRDGAPVWLLVLLAVGILSGAARSFADASDVNVTGIVTRVEGDEACVELQSGALSSGDRVRMRVQSPARKAPDSPAIPEAPRPWMDDRAYFPG